MIIDCISDLHGYYPKLKGGDLLIIAGDLTARDAFLEHMNFLDWLIRQEYKKKILIAGNHDNYLQQHVSSSIQRNRTLEIKGIDYLCDSGTEFEGLKIWGSPWTASFPGMNPKCMAFTMPFGCDNEEHLAEMWAMIPNDTDILVTHGPPYSIRDGKNPDQNLGSSSLMKRISNINLKLNVFGHIHEGHGVMDMRSLKLKNGFQAGIYVNASYVNEHYQPVNKPIRVIL